MTVREGAVVRTDRIAYREAWATQRRLVAARRAGDIPDVVWLLEHPPTYTTGRHGTRADLHLTMRRWPRRAACTLRPTAAGR